MKYYKSNDGRVYGFESDGSQDKHIKSDFIPITEAEARIIANPPPTPEQLQQQAEQEKLYLMSRALNAIAPLQYAVDLHMATNAEQSKLTEWKKYMVLLNRVDCSAAPNIDWPKAPE
ncbi:tail fiber assembly protein [Xenorhabdus ehlersii]|uniref:Tail fiber assembly protein n=1 Tax=Xenorhabdus ehlersii TaxID=290111 RepID=A0A2D0IJS1_9GAMM|nr:tail fiber assembly protein [Xenorhabdus ehlersii]PHM22018.1 tail fiber assembly protein [Xenorhabdus ehlersii]RKE88648.1 virus tail fiber assembly protein lambda gpK [Xenorhabdus ehlersii]